MEEHISSKDRFLLQSDWNTAVKLCDKEIWVGYQETRTKKSKFEILNLEAFDKETKIVPCSDANFKAKMYEEECCLSLSSSIPSCSAKFFGPVASFGVAQGSSIHSLDVSNGGLGVSSSGKDLIIWNTAEGTVEKKLQGHKLDVYRCRIFPSGVVVLSAGADMQIKIFSAASGVCARTLLGHTQGVADLGIIDVGRNVVSCSRDGSCRVWDCGSSNTLTLIKPQCGPLNALMLCNSRNVGNELNESIMSASSKIVVLGSERGLIVAHGLDSSCQVFKYHGGSPVNTIHCLHDGNIIFGCDDGSLSTLDLRYPQKPLFHYKTHRGAVHRVLPYRSGFVASFGDGTVIFEKEIEETDDMIEFSCAEGDPVYDMALTTTHLFTCSRDKFIRKYRLPR